MRGRERASRPSPLASFGSSWLDCQAQVIAINFFVRGNLRNRTNKAVVRMYAVARRPRPFRPFPRSVHVYLDCGWNKIQQPSRTHAARPPCSCSPTDGQTPRLCNDYGVMGAPATASGKKSYLHIASGLRIRRSILPILQKIRQLSGAVSEIRICLPLCLSKLSLVP